MSDNKKLWARAFTTDPKAVKPITGKDYAGNSPKPYWIIERLTDEFGPCGIGWGFNVVNERFERFSDVDSLHIALVRFWYVFDGVRGELEQVGQTKASYMTSKGTFKIDEDAPKKSVTDALVKCASYLGFAGDIFSGRWDDSRYVAEAKAEWDARKRESADVRPIKGTDGIENSVSEDRRNELDQMALEMIEGWREGHGLAVARDYYALERNDDKVYLWKCFAAESKMRADIKANSPHKVAA